MAQHPPIGRLVLVFQMDSRETERMMPLQEPSSPVVRPKLLPVPFRQVGLVKEVHRVLVFVEVHLSLFVLADNGQSLILWQAGLLLLTLCTTSARSPQQRWRGGRVLQSAERAELLVEGGAVA